MVRPRDADIAFFRGIVALSWFSPQAGAGMIMPTKPTMVEIDMSQLEDALRRAEAKLDEKDFAMLKALAESYAYLTDLVGDKTRPSLACESCSSERRPRRLRRWSTAPRIRDLCQRRRQPLRPSRRWKPTPKPRFLPPRTAKTRRKRQARATAAMGLTPTPGREDRGGAPVAPAGRSLPAVRRGHGLRTKRPGVLVRLVGQPPVGTKVYYLQKLRCNFCGVVFTADLPAGVDVEEKYAPTVGSMIALLKYGSGMPFHRAETLQENLGVPLPASTQWDIVEAQAECTEPVFAELVRQAAQGDVVFNDDTGVKILEMMGERARQAALADETSENSVGASTKTPAEDRTGMFTSGIISTREGHKIALFLSGRQHAGENLKDVLARRARSCPRQFRCAMHYRGIGHPLGTENCRRFLPTVWPTADGSSLTWQSDFPRNVGTCWKRSP